MSRLTTMVMDAWTREANEAVKLVEDVETTVKCKNNIVEEQRQQQQQQQQHGLGDDIARSKLLEAGVKLDRLESLLYNPPTKPILTKEDLEHRWRMLSETKLKMKALAVSLYAVSSPDRTVDIPVGDMGETSTTASSYDHDQIKASFAEDELELLKPLVSDNTSQSCKQIKRFDSFTSASFLSRVCWAVLVILGAAAILLILVILCAII